MKPAKNPLAAAAGRLATAVVTLLEPAAETEPAAVETRAEPGPEEP